MAWDFSTDPEFQEKLDWADRFVREEVEPFDVLLARRVLKGYRPSPDVWPTQFKPRALVEARRKFDARQERGSVI